MFWRSFRPQGATDTQLRQAPQVLELPKTDMFLAAIVRIIRDVYGFAGSVDVGKPVDGEGRALPLYTYPAIEYLDQFDYSSLSVFEFGAGSSTLYWMERVASLVSVENNPDWFGPLREQVNDRVELVLDKTDAYPTRIRDYDRDFDVIIIDGDGYRYDCAVEAVEKLAEGGMIVLDNADWHHKSAEFLRKSDLIQVDMTGFKPAEPYASTTSLFLHRSFSMKPRTDRQPSFGMGSKQLHSSAWDKPYARKGNDGSRN